MHVLPSPDSQDTVRESDCLQKRRSDRSPELLSSNAAMIVLSIYKNNPKKGWGTIRNMAFEDPIPCEDLLDAILKMNCIYDRMDFPMTMFERRSFFGRRDITEPDWKRSKTVSWCPDDYLDGSADVSLIIHTLVRGNASWQGRVTWVQACKTQNYRSVLELVYLIREAIGFD